LPPPPPGHQSDYRSSTVFPILVKKDFQSHSFKVHGHKYSSPVLRRDRTPTLLSDMYVIPRHLIALRNTPIVIALLRSSQLLHKSGTSRRFKLFELGVHFHEIVPVDNPSPKSTRLLSLPHLRLSKHVPRLAFPPRSSWARLCTPPPLFGSILVIFLDPSKSFSFLTFFFPVPPLQDLRVLFLLLVSLFFS